MPSVCSHCCSDHYDGGHCYGRRVHLLPLAPHQPEGAPAAAVFRSWGNPKGSCWPSSAGPLDQYQLQPGHPPWCELSCQHDETPWAPDEAAQGDECVRAILYYLETTILLVTLVNTNEHCPHVWKEAAIVVPVAWERRKKVTVRDLWCLPVVLVPDKGPSCACFLHHQLGVVVVDLSSQQILHGGHYLLTATHHSCDILSRMVPQAHSTGPPMAVISSIGVLHDLSIFLKKLLKLL